MKQSRLNIVTKTEKYPIIIGSNLTSSISKIFKSNSIGFDKCLIVVDKKSFKHNPAQWPISFPPSKTIFCGKKNAGKNINEITIIPVKKKIENIMFLIICVKS